MNFIRKNNYLIFVMVLCVAFTFASINKLEKEVMYDSLTVGAGDTLWDYSIQYAENIPNEEWINEIVKINNLTSTTIRVGDELRIPVKQEPFDHNEIATNTLEQDN